MKSIFLTTVLFSLSALAQGPDNINGINGRLELLTCQGAYQMTLAKAEKLEEEMDRKCSTAEDEELCRINIFKSYAKAAPEAVFNALAEEGLKTFKVTVSEGGKTILRSTRLGSHADGRTGIMLTFHLPESEDYRYNIDTGILSSDAKTAPYLFVPVRRRILADLLYLFTEGCSLVWQD